MFRKAYPLASGFTWPVVLSRRTLEGQCYSAIGSLVVINDEGWIATAHHIVELFQQMIAEKDAVDKFQADRAAIENDGTIDAREKKRRLKKIDHVPRTHAQKCSAWWGRDGVVCTTITSVPLIDLAVGKLEPFDPTWIPTYPVIKDPSRDFVPGTSLCKLGFPFHDIKPTWNDTKDAFELPAGSLPCPRFPIEGIYTRDIEVVPAGGPPPFPLKFLETSTPGLRGQSGGPIFDERGTIWAIQSQTIHHPLGFDPEVPNSGGRKEHQFLNVGLGSHALSIKCFLEEQHIKFTLSDY